MGESKGGISIRRKWLAFGLVVAFFHYALLVPMIYLLQVDVRLAVIVVVVNVVIGFGLLIFVLYVY